MSVDTESWDEFYQAWGKMVDESYLFSEAAWRSGMDAMRAMARLDAYLEDQAIPNPLIRPRNE